MTKKGKKKGGIAVGNKQTVVVVKKTLVKGKKNKTPTKAAKQTALALKPKSPGISKLKTAKKTAGKTKGKAVVKEVKKDEGKKTLGKKEKGPALTPKKAKTKIEKKVKPKLPKPEDLDKDLDSYMAAAPETIPA